MEGYAESEDKKVLNEAAKAVHLAMKSTLNSFKTNTPLTTSTEFLKRLAKTAIEKLEDKDYNVIVGEDLIKVFKYQKDSFVSLKWDKLILTLFKVPSNPQFPLTNDLLIDNEVIAKYIFKSTIELKNLKTL